MAGTWELICLGMIARGLTKHNPQNLAHGSAGLIIFTAAVTTVFWLRPLNEVMALHNLSAVGGLLLLLIMRNDVILALREKRTTKE